MSQKDSFGYGIYGEGSRNIPIPSLSEYDEEIIASPHVFRNSKGEALGVIIFQTILIVLALVGALMKRINPLTHLSNQLEESPVALLFMASLFILGFLFALWKFLDRRPKLTISKEGIRIKRRLFPWTSIRYLDMISKRPKPRSGRPSPGTTHFLYLYDSRNKRFKISLDGLDAKTPAIVTSISNFRAYDQHHKKTQ